MGLDGPSAPINTPNPVNYAYGNKAYSVVDLHVQLPGRDFTVARSYSSHPDFQGAGLVGKNWMLSVFYFLEIVDVAGETLLALGAPTTGKTHFVHDGLVEWRPTGPTAQYIVESSVIIDGPLTDVWRLIEPGRWEVDFYRDNADSRLDGLPLQLRDPYGNVRTFEYTLFVAEPADVYRLTTIYLGGTPTGGNEVARVQLAWIGSGTNHLRLESIEVERDSPASVATQRVEYTYMDEASASPDYHDALGTNGDLVQVAKYVKIDNAPDGTPSGEDGWYITVAQYRYHGGLLNEATDTDLDGFIEKGGDHQLKAVLLPEQVEFSVQQANRDAPSPPVSVLVKAAEWLEQPDNHVVFTDEGLDDYTVMDIAARVIEQYETTGNDKRVKTQYLQSACGCAGATQGLRLDYHYFSYSTTGNGQYAKTTKILEYVWNDPIYELHRIRYYDLVIYEEDLPGTIDVPYYYMANGAVEEDPGGVFDGWVRHFEYNDNGRTMKRMMYPSATASYTPGTATTAPTYSAKSDSGLVYGYVFISNNRLGLICFRQGEDPDITNFTVRGRVTYGDPQWGPDQRKHLPTFIERFRTEVTVGSPTPPALDVELVKLTYKFHGDDGDDIYWIEAKIESGLLAENGPGVSYYVHEFFDTNGLNYWSRRVDDTLIRRDFDPDTGVVTEEEWNAAPGPPAPLPSSNMNGRNSDGGSLKYTYTHDLLGRITSVVVPGGPTTRYVREVRLLSSERPGILYYATVVLPHTFLEDGQDKFAGRATVTWMSAGSEGIANSGYNLVADQASQYGPTYLFSLTNELSRATVQHHVSGLVKSVERRHSLAGHGENGGLYITQYAYDSLGRVETFTSPRGTINEYTYDILDRMTAVEVGTSPTDVETVAEYFYDSDGQPSQGLGDGNLTLVREHVTGSTVRDTKYDYDFRNRLEKVENPDAPHVFLIYDNLDRLEKAALFKNVPTGPSDVTNTNPNRGLYISNAYDQRGLLFRQRIAIDPKVVESSMTFLETHTWYDEVGRAVEVWGPNGPATKTSYDALGRPLVTYLTDRRDDDDPDPLNPPSGIHDKVYDSTTHKVKVDGDVVFEQQEYHYVQPGDYTGDAFTGVSDLVTSRLRAHGLPDTDTGDLADFAAIGADDEKVITTYTATFYDGATRPMRSVDYGTNRAGFEYSPSLVDDRPSINLNSPPQWNSAGDQLVSETAYNDRGLVDTTTDPTGQVTKVIYDDLNRVIAVVENHEDAALAVDPWDEVNELWVFTGLESNEQDKDRVTSTVYLVTLATDPRIKYVAHTFDDLGADDVQVTQYVYGVPKGFSPGQSFLASNDLLYKIIYPDVEASEADHRELFAYNRLGEPFYAEDQNGTVHIYLYDAMGRLETDRVFFFGPDIDQTIDAIGVAYNDLGLLEFVRSYSSYGQGGQQTENAVQVEYTDLGQVKDVFQDPDGDIDGGSLKVSYGYITKQMADGNYSRLDKLTHPNGVIVPYRYGPAGSSDSLISRITDVVYKTGPRYDYVGLGLTAVVDLPTVDLQLDRTAEHTGERQSVGYTDNPGKYPGLDQFGRAIRHMWVDGDFTTHASSSTVPNVPPIVELEFTYDKASNRTAAYDARPGALRENRDFEYAYDGLDRLTTADRGAKGPPFDYVDFVNLDENFTPSQAWTLDLLGNWDDLVTDKDGNGAGGGGTDVTEPRSHNDVNELNDRDPDGTSGPDPALELTYDKAGNLREQDLSDTAAYRYTHDAWGRLVTIEHVTNPVVNLRAEFEYNGLSWVTVKRADTADIPDGLDQERTRYYSAGWQLLEERIDDDLDAIPDRHVHLIWGIRYIDDLVMRREDGNRDGDFIDPEDSTWYHLSDAQFSTVAIVDDAAALVERVSYDAYGRARHHYMADVDGDGDALQEDFDIINSLAQSQGLPPGTPIEDRDYNVDADIDRSGRVDPTDYDIATAPGQRPALAIGLLSDDDVENIFGFSGYVYNGEVALYTVRFRHYDTVLGRWLERDPLGYVDGMVLYDYVGGRVFVFIDPFGLAPEWLHTTLDVVGLVPGVGDLADLVNAVIYATEGDWVNVAVSAAAAIPGVGAAATGGKWAARAAKAARAARNPAWWGIGAVPTAGKWIVRGVRKLRPRKTPRQAPGVGPGAIKLHPTKPPGKDWVWRGNGPPQSGKGAWYNPKTGESIHPDLHHPPPIGPHYDYKNRRTGEKYRIFPDGTCKPK